MDMDGRNASVRSFNPTHCYASTLVPMKGYARPAGMVHRLRNIDSKATVCGLLATGSAAYQPEVQCEQCEQCKG